MTGEDFNFLASLLACLSLSSASDSSMNLKRLGQLIQAPVIKINIPFPFLPLEVASPQFNLLFEPFVNLRPKVLSVTNVTFCGSSLAFFWWLVLVAVGIC
jgi:hypothetical protein